MSEDYLTVKEAAELARCSVRTIYRAFQSGALIGFRPMHRAMFREEDVRAWVEQPRPTVAPTRPRAVSPRRRAVTGSVQALREMERLAGEGGGR